MNITEEQYDLEQMILPELYTLSDDQESAVDAIWNWYNNSSSSFFLLHGAAGTGKTFCVQDLIDDIKGKIVFTAPTNKATKVLRQTLTSDDYTPICRTIYSLLGLKLEPNGAVKELKAPEDPIDLSKIKLVVVDEASMVNEVLMKEISKAAGNYKLKFLFMGDSNQLPPVKELKSKVWENVKEDLQAELVEVMRFDNQILNLAGELRGKVDHPCPSIKFQPDNDGVEGIWVQKPDEFMQSILAAAENGDFSNPQKQVKAIAWRNTQVATLNSMIRQKIFDNAYEEAWFPGDRIILTSPAKDFESDNTIAHTDDEGTVDRVEMAPHPKYPDFTCYKLAVITDENKRITIWTIHPNAVPQFKFEQNRLMKEAKLSPWKWKDFWEFTDAFHKTQHGYALTAHRAQGSTYDTCYVVWNDILLNRNRQEAFRCLYVACTRAKKKLILGGL